MRNMVGSKHFSCVCWGGAVGAGVRSLALLTYMCLSPHPVEAKSRQLHKTVWGPGERLGWDTRLGITIV